MSTLPLALGALEITMDPDQDPSKSDQVQEETSSVLDTKAMKKIPSGNWARKFPPGSSSPKLGGPIILIKTVAVLPDGLQGCEVRQSEVEGRGLGLFATRDILPGNILLAEIPLLVSVEIGTRADPVETAFEALSHSDQALYRSLHAYRPKKRLLHDTLNRSIMYTNGFHIGSGNNKTGVFLLASRINHSCVPNSGYVWHDANITQELDDDGKEIEVELEPGRMVFTNRFKLLEGEEVTIDYGHSPKALLSFYGFECDCGGCTDPGSSVASTTPSTDGKEVEDQGNIEQMRIDNEKALLKEEYASDWALRRRRSLPVEEDPDDEGTPSEAGQTNELVRNGGGTESVRVD